MTPVLRSVQRKLLESLHQENTRVADVSTSWLGELEAPGEELFILGAGSEPGTARLGFADAATICRAMNQALVK